MKKKLLIGMSMLLAVILWVGCQEKDQSKPVNETSFADLENWLDENGFDENISQIKLKDFVESLIYNGKEIEYMTTHFDGEGGGGASGNNKNETLGFSNSYSREKGSKTAKASNSFYTKLNLDNFSLPGELRIGDTFSHVMKTLMITDSDPIQNFVSDEDDESTMTLKREGNASIRYRIVNEYTKTLSFVLEESYGEKDDRMTRKINFWFDKDLELTIVSISVLEIIDKG